MPMFSNVSKILAPAMLVNKTIKIDSKCLESKNLQANDFSIE